MFDLPKTNQVGHNAAASNFPGEPRSLLRQEYLARQELFGSQPFVIQRFLDNQARLLVDALEKRPFQVQFSLPDRVRAAKPYHRQTEFLTVPPDQREQLAGGLISRMTSSRLKDELQQRLLDLDQSSEPALSIAAKLLSHAIAWHIVYSRLPDGNKVTYKAVEGETIETIPIVNRREPSAAITAATDAIIEEDDGAKRAELLVPFVPYARRFYIPQWVVFDDQGHLLVNSINEAEANVASMQRFMENLQTAAELASHIVVDEAYQQKRYGMLGQLVNQARALASYETSEIIDTIRRRAAAEELNRGLSLSLPFFDDQELKMKTWNFEVIPAGRILFVPAFVVRAARFELARVPQETELSPSTRAHLMAELRQLEQVFSLRKTNS
jgi:hypothetical protein